MYKKYIKPETDIAQMVIENLMGKMDSTGDTDGQEGLGNVGTFDEEENMSVGGNIWED
jgi:hypothetical protein